jgi:hypothetical protein
MTKVVIFYLFLKIPYCQGRISISRNNTTPIATVTQRKQFTRINHKQTTTLNPCIEVSYIIICIRLVVLVLERSYILFSIHVLLTHLVNLLNISINDRKKPFKTLNTTIRNQAIRVRIWVLTIYFIIMLSCFLSINLPAI